MSGYLKLALTIAALATTTPVFSADVAPPPVLQVSAPSITSQEKITPYQARFGRQRPVIAVIGENSGTELVDFVVPYGLLAQADIAEVISVATQSGPLQFLPSLHIQPNATAAEFDKRYPEGADYLIVPAVRNPEDKTLLDWVAAQGAKGATVVSICDGALVVANSGLMRGHRATGHWATQAQREKQYPDTQWLKNIRYVADGKIVSSAGVSAAIPTSLALVEAIAGTARATALAQEVGADGWDTQHDSTVFHLGFGVYMNAIGNWLHPTQKLGVPVAAGVDEVALALTADAYSRTFRSKVYAVAPSMQAITTRHGLTLLPDRSSDDKIDRLLPEIETAASTQMLDKALQGIAASYGESTANSVALGMEYPRKSQ